MKPLVRSGSVHHRSIHSGTTILEEMATMHQKESFYKSGLLQVLRWQRGQLPPETTKGRKSLLSNCCKVSKKEIVKTG